MRVLFLGNNWLGWQVLRWLKAEREEIVGVVMHPPRRRRYGDALVAEAGGLPIFEGSRLRDPAVLQSLRELNCEIAVSILFGYILRPEFIALPSAGCINLHPSLLPYNRGAHPNVWSIIDGTPAGTTLHYIDPGVDTGDIIAQREIAVLPIDTGETLYRRLEQVSLDLFKETWPAVRMGNPPRVPQGSHPGTSHHSSDLQRIDAIDLDATYKARDLINLMRARTFSPYPGAHFQCGGRRIYISLQLAFGDESRS